MFTEVLKYATTKLTCMYYCITFIRKSHAVIIIIIVILLQGFPTQ